jgi:hypothetical protein
MGSVAGPLDYRADAGQLYFITPLPSLRILSLAKPHGA